MVPFRKTWFQHNFTPVTYGQLVKQNQTIRRRLISTFSWKNATWRLVYLMQSFLPKYEVLKVLEAQVTTPKSRSREKTKETRENYKSKREKTRLFKRKYTRASSPRLRDNVCFFGFLEVVLVPLFFEVFFVFGSFFCTSKLLFKYVVFSVAATSACPTCPLVYKQDETVKTTLNASWKVHSSGLPCCFFTSTSCHSFASEDLVKHVEPQLIMLGGTWWNRTAPSRLPTRNRYIVWRLKE